MPNPNLSPERDAEIRKIAQRGAGCLCGHFDDCPHGEMFPVFRALNDTLAALDATTKALGTIVDLTDPQVRDVADMDKALLEIRHASRAALNCLRE